VEEQTREQQEQAQKAWSDLTRHPLIQAFREAAKPAPHVHGPFVFLMNQNHNALRGCTTCGQAWVGVMAGDEDSIRWHVVAEPPEEEEIEED
jgi:hypothetical protein